MQTIIRHSLLGLAACAALSTPCVAATLPAAQGSIRFEEFEDSTGQSITACDRTTSGVASSNCSGLTIYTGGPLGAGFHVSGTKSGSGAITNSGGAPKVSTTLSGGGGDGISGAGIAEVDTQLDYYVTVLPLGTLGTAGLIIPLTFTDAGGFHESGSNAEVIADARTFVDAFTGDITVDGGRSSLNDDVGDTVESGLLDESYSQTHHLLFDFEEGDVIAKVSLSARCSWGALVAAGVSATCNAFADPFIGFDQSAFDATMGPHTFNLSDAFQIVVSPGLQPAGGLPEPATWTLFIAGFGLAGAALRRRVASVA